MNHAIEIPLPYSFNLLKHHLGYIRSFTAACRECKEGGVVAGLMEEVARIGSSVTDIYTGSLTVWNIIDEVAAAINSTGVRSPDNFGLWAGGGRGDFQLVRLHDSSSWILKYLGGQERYIHLFPARGSALSLRERGNSLKSAILLAINSFDASCTVEEINRIRKPAGLPPVRSAEYVGAIKRMLDLIC